MDFCFTLNWQVFDKFPPGIFPRHPFTLSAHVPYGVNHTVAVVITMTFIYSFLSLLSHLVAGVCGVNILSYDSRAPPTDQTWLVTSAQH